MLHSVSTTPFSDQKPGTFGLRKAVPISQQPHCLENFVQAIYDLFGSCAGKTLVLGGNGRYYNQGFRIEFTNVAQIVLRLSGTSTQGATLRTYFASYEPSRSQQNRAKGAERAASDRR